MLIGKRCTICHDRVGGETVTECETCGRELHAPCESYETAFECARCGDEPWIGASEF